MRRHRHGNLIDSFRYALQGLAYVLRAERNARVHVAVSVIVVLLSAWLRLSLLEWVLMIMAIALVFAGEMLNTVVELVIDIVAPHQNDLATCQGWRRRRPVAATPPLPPGHRPAPVGAPQRHLAG